MGRTALLCTVLLLCAFSLAAAAPEFLATELTCNSALCHESTLSLVSWNGGKNLESLATVAKDLTKKLREGGHYAKADYPVKNLYYVLSLPGGPTQLIMYDTAQFQVVTRVNLPADKFGMLHGIEYDLVQKRLFAVFQNQLVSVNIQTGDLTPIATLWQDAQIVNTNVTTYDVNTGNFFAMGKDDGQSVWYLFAANTYTGAVVRSPAFTAGSVNVPSPVSLHFDSINNRLLVFATMILGPSVYTANMTSNQLQVIADFRQFVGLTSEGNADTNMYDQSSRTLYMVLYDDQLNPNMVGIFLPTSGKPNVVFQQQMPSKYLSNLVLKSTN